MHAVLTNQIADILHFNDNEVYVILNDGELELKWGCIIQS